LIQQSSEQLQLDESKGDFSSDTLMDLLNHEVFYQLLHLLWSNKNKSHLFISHRLDGENKEMRPVHIVSIFTSDDLVHLLAPESKEATLW
jgi:mRNA-degrading endonuclease YafQ of YafQ-DinJ toxin-antitoxin module